MLGQFEIEFLKFLESFRTPFLSKVAEIVTMIGEEMIFIALAAVLYFIIDKKLGQKMIYIVCCGVGLNGIVKNFAAVPRPFVKDPTLNAVRVETATGYSFPSGHSQTASTWMTALCVRLKKWWAWLIAIVLMLSVAFSRLMLGVHYPSDVVTGLLLGLFSALFFGWLYDRWEKKQIAIAVLLLLYLTFGVVFLFRPDPEYADFYKMLGLSCGFACAYLFERRFVNFTNDVPVWKRIIRCLVGIGLALGIRVGLSALFGLFTVGTVGSLLFGAVRYFAIGFVVIGVYPLVFKKLKF